MALLKKVPVLVSIFKTKYDHDLWSFSISVILEEFHLLAPLVYLQSNYRNQSHYADNQDEGCEIHWIPTSDLEKCYSLCSFKYISVN